MKTMKQVLFMTIASVAVISANAQRGSLVTNAAQSASLRASTQAATRSASVNAARINNQASLRSNQVLNKADKLRTGVVVREQSRINGSIQANANANANAKVNSNENSVLIKTETEQSATVNAEVDSKEKVNKLKETAVETGLKASAEAKAKKG